MRAIGASRPFVILLFLCESAFLSFFSVFMGAFLSFLVIVYLKQNPLLAPNDITAFLFGGKFLYMDLSWDILLGVPLMIFILTLVCSLYPIRYVTKIQPIQAIQGKE